MKELPQVSAFYMPTLQAIEGLGGSGSVREIDDRLSSTFLGSGASATESDLKRFSDFCSRARRRLKNALMIEAGNQGIWALTAEGRVNLDADETSLIKLVTDRHWAHRKGHSLSLEVSVEESSNEEAERQPASTSVNWMDELLGILKAMPPKSFEHLCQRLLRESGFLQVKVTGQSSDGGIDGRGILRLGLVTFPVIFQCKRYQGSVGSSVVRDFRGAMAGRTDKGLIITTGTFTGEAWREATRDGAPAIDLIDGPTLCERLRDLNIGVKVRMVPEVTVDAAAFAAF